MLNKSFILNDQSKLNSHGFRTLNAGIDLERFNSNPVILDSHLNRNESVIGKWTNIRIEGSQLLADAEFDLEDADAAKIAGKVERGFLRGVSMGLGLNQEDLVINKEFGGYDLQKCELFEASIVSTPSNANALKLYAQDGHMLTEKEIELSLQSVERVITPKQTNMKQIMLSVAALTVLGLQNTEDPEKLSVAVEGLVEKLKASEQAKQELQSKIDAQLNGQITELIDKAISDGKITADAKTEWEQMASANLTAVTKTLASLPVKAVLAATIVPVVSGEIKTVDDFQKLSHSEQLSFKENSPVEYKKLFA